jgi:CBS domain-containing protein
MLLQELVDHHILSHGRRVFVVKQGEELAGLLTLHRIKDVPRAQWPSITAAQVMIPLERLKCIQADADLWAALKAMDADGVNQMPVMREGHMLGMLTRENIISYLGTVQEFER